jgi:hypothetical protein
MYGIPTLTPDLTIYCRLGPRYIFFYLLSFPYLRMFFFCGFIKYTLSMVPN